jgi:LysR family glycine cleavage system transcriptional activator
VSKRLPSLESIRFLEACVRHASFTRAASELGVTPAAVSLRIRELESELGTKLFYRAGPKIASTDAGRILAGGMREALDHVSRAVEASRGNIGPLRVTAVPSLAQRWLTPRLSRYHALPDAAPISLDTSMELRTATTFDVGIRTGDGNWPGLDAIPLMPVDATPMMSGSLCADIALSSPSDLAKLPLLPHDDWPRWFREVGTPDPILRFCPDEYPTHDLDAVAAVEGEGVALLSPVLFASYVRDKRLVQPFAHIMCGPAWHYAVVREGETRPAVLRFREWLRSQAAT